MGGKLGGTARGFEISSCYVLRYLAITEGKLSVAVLDLFCFEISFIALRQTNTKIPHMTMGINMFSWLLHSLVIIIIGTYCA